MDDGYAFAEEFLARLTSPNVIKGLGIFGCEDKRTMRGAGAARADPELRTSGGASRQLLPLCRAWRVLVLVSMRLRADAECCLIRMLCDLHVAQLCPALVLFDLRGIGSL